MSFYATYSRYEYENSCYIINTRGEWFGATEITLFQTCGNDSLLMFMVVFLRVIFYI